jgi:hypothetical protein
MNLNRNNTLIVSRQDFETVCKDFYKLGYWDAEEIDNATRQGDSDEEFDIMFNDNKNRVLNYFEPTPNKSCYVIPKEILDEILAQANKKRDAWQFPNEMWIEADSSIGVVEYIIQNSQLI